MSLRVVTPASGAAQLTINWDGGSSTVCAGQVVDIPAGGALEAAYGLTNLTALTGAALANDQGGGDPSVVANA